MGGLQRRRTLGVGSSVVCGGGIRRRGIMRRTNVLLTWLRMSTSLREVEFGKDVEFAFLLGVVSRRSEAHCAYLEFFGIEDG